MTNKNENRGTAKSGPVEGVEDWAVDTPEEAPPFLLALLTLPHNFPDEALLLEELLEAGLPKLHIRKPDASEMQLTALLSLLCPRWSSRLVLHGSPQLAKRYHIPQLHGSVGYSNGQGRSGGGPFIEERSAFAVSTSVHSWTEFGLLPSGLSYAFISPLFDSISKPGYAAGTGLLQLPSGLLPCTPVGLGGIGADSLGEMIRMGWKGAAVLGYIWEEPKKALNRFLQLKKIIDAEGG